MIVVYLFGRMADVIGMRRLEADPAVAGSLVILRDQIFAEAIESGRIAKHDIRMSLNQAVVADDRPLNDGDEVAFFSVFSGG